MGSVASNTIFPGGSGQEPHIDYPYWDYFKSENWPAEPKHKDIPFFMNLQVRAHASPLSVSIVLCKFS